MGKVLLDMAITLDGFIGGRNGEHHGIYDWYFAERDGTNDGDQQIVDELQHGLGAIIMGRNTYGNGDDGDDNPYKMPHFVVTHQPPAQLPNGSTEYIFVTDGIESALRQAQARAGVKEIAIAGGADLAQQYLEAGLIDEIQVHIAPILIGDGLRLFDLALSTPLKLEKTRLIESPTVTHIRYRVLK